MNKKVENLHKKWYNKFIEGKYFYIVLEHILITFKTWQLPRRKKL